MTERTLDPARWLPADVRAKSRLPRGKRESYPASKSSDDRSHRGATAMQRIRIPSEHWGPVWRALVAAGPVSRLSGQPVYLVTEQQFHLLRRKKLPFELLGPPNGSASDKRDG